MARKVGRWRSGGPGSCQAVERDKEDGRETTEGAEKPTNRELKIEEMLTPTAPLFNATPTNGLSGFALKGLPSQVAGLLPVLFSIWSERSNPFALFICQARFYNISMSLHLLLSRHQLNARLEPLHTAIWYL